MTKNQKIDRIRTIQAKAEAEVNAQFAMDLERIRKEFNRNVTRASNTVSRRIKEIDETFEAGLEVINSIYG